MNEITDFYTPTGIHVYFKDKMVNDEIDLEKVISKVESIVPIHCLTEVEMIIVGWFDEFEERNLSAFYKDSALYVSNIQQSNEELYEVIIHEIAHSLEGDYGYELYGDEKMKDEFLRKREYLHDILWKADFKAPLSLFMEIEYNEEFDMFLFEDIGYDKLITILSGVFINAYAPTSLREYFATGFADYFIEPNHKFLQNVSPLLYQKIEKVLKEPDFT